MPRFDVGETECRALYLAAYQVNNAHRVINKKAIAAQIRSDEYSSLNMQNWNNAGLDVGQR